MALSSERKPRTKELLFMAVWYRDDPIRNISLERPFLSRQCKNRCGKNDISCVISGFGDY